METDKKHRYGQKVEQYIASMCIEGEYKVSKARQEREERDFEAMIDILECQRTEGDYEWESDIFLPEYPSMWLTQMSMYGAQYFQTRDFVEVKLQDGSTESKAKADAAKECLNRTLNQRHLRYFQKYMRAKGIRDIHKHVIYRCWWERKDRPVVTGFKTRMEPMMDNFGFMTDREVREPVIENEPIVDRFNFDVLDPRNVVVSPEYTYSLQDKRYVYIRYEATLDQLKKDAETHGYFNLDLLEKREPPRETETSRESYGKDQADDQGHGLIPQSSPYDIVERYGGAWVMVTKRDEITGEPLESEPAYDEFGKIKDGAEFEEVVKGWAIPEGGSPVLIRYHLTPYVDTTGVPYRPLVRDLCYIHPTKDGGMGDGPIARESQVAINDTFNLSNDRVRLATIPTLKVNKYDAEDNDTIWVGPGHKMELTDVKNVEELKIRDDIGGALSQIAMLKDGMQKGLAIFPTTQGQLPSSEQTATAVAGTEARASSRSSYKSLTSEYTGLTELYWIILTMTRKFAHPKTGLKLMGEKVYDFQFSSADDYWYKPLSQSIETESSKVNKRKDIGSMFGYIVNVPNRNTAKVLNQLLMKYLETFGDEHEDIKKALFDESDPRTAMGGGGNTVPASPTAPMSNQNMTPMSTMEQATRGAMNAG